MLVRQTSDGRPSNVILGDEIQILRHSTNELLLRVYLVSTENSPLSNDILAVIPIGLVEATNNNMSIFGWFSSGGRAKDVRRTSVGRPSDVRRTSFGREN